MAKINFGIFSVLETVLCEGSLCETRVSLLSYFLGEKSDPQNFDVVSFLAKICFLETENHGFSKDFLFFSPKLCG